MNNDLYMNGRPIGAQIDISALLSSLQQEMESSRGTAALIVSLSASLPVLYISDSAHALGLSAAFFNSLPQLWMDVIHPDDKAHVWEVVSGATYASPLSLNFRVLGEDRRVIYLHARMRLTLCPPDDTPCLAGTLSVRHAPQSALDEELTLNRRITDKPAQDFPGVKLADIISVESLQKQQSDLAEMFDVYSVITDAYGYAITTPSNHSPACGYLDQQPTSESCCTHILLRQIAQKVRQTGKRNITVCPFSGLTLVAEPINISGKLIAIWIAGQVKLYKANVHELLPLKKADEAVQKQFLDHLAAMKTFDENRFEDMYRLLILLGENFSLLGTRNMQLIQQIDRTSHTSTLLKKNYEFQILLNQCFSLLHSTDAVGDSLGMILATAGRHLHLARTYIYQLDRAGTLSLTHEWHSTGEDPIPGVQHTLSLPLPDAYSTNETLYYDVGQLQADTELAQFALQRGVSAMIHAPILRGARLHGLVGFDAGDIENPPTDSEADIIEALLRLLAGAVLHADAEAEALLSMQSLQSVMNNMTSYIIVLDIQNHELLFANKAAQQAFSDMDAFISRLVLQILNAKTPHSQSGSLSGEFYYPPTGQWLHVVTGTFDWTEGRRVLMLSGTDITDLKNNELIIEHMAYHDAMLNLPNRRKFEIDLEAVLTRAASSGESGILLFIDLDDFKFINDAFGHERGDALLSKMVEYLAQEPLLADVLYRYGGDEFMALLYGVTPEQLRQLIDRLTERFQAPWVLAQDEEYFCTASIGIAVFPQDGTSMRDILRSADMARYKAKFDSKGGVVYFDEKLDTELDARLHLEWKLRHAVLDDCKEFEVYYQPLCDVNTGRYIGAEALLRWMNPDLGMIMPDEFIALAETLGLIVPIGMWMLNKVMRDFKDWGIDHKNFYVSANLSMRQLQSDSLVEDVRTLITRHGFPAHKLMLEVTESMTAYDAQGVINKLIKLREMGIRISLDDFGTGYSSLSKLRDLPLDMIKIDRSFLMNVDTDEYSRTFIRTIVMLAHSANLSVCTEGVETELQMSVVREYKSDFAQGTLVSSPLPFREFVEICR